MQLAARGAPRTRPPNGAADPARTSGPVRPDAHGARFKPARTADARQHSTRRCHDRKDSKALPTQVCKGLPVGHHGDGLVSDQYLAAFLPTFTGHHPYFVRSG